MRIITAFSPTVPMWSIYWDTDDDEILTLPVICLAVVEDDNGETYITPISFASDGIFEPDDTLSNLLGYSTVENPPKEAYQYSLDQLKKRELKRRKGK